MAGRPKSWSLAARGREEGEKQFLWLELVYFLRRGHQPAGGESRLGGAAISPVTLPVGLAAPPARHVNVSETVGIEPPVYAGGNAATRRCHCQTRH